ncbi:MAG: tyrosine-type recombinase/integrase [Dongiaceae bacterium]
MTFARAAGLYKTDRNRIARLQAVLGKKLVSEIQHADLVDAADRLYPGRKNATKNRGAIKPAAAILHYAAKNRWCEWLRIERFAEDPVPTRASDDATARALLAALGEAEAAARTPHKRRLAAGKRLLVLWLFRHWNRVSDPLRPSWDDIDLQRRTYRVLIGKTSTWREKPLDEEVWEVLANVAAKEARLFPWRTRSGVYKWLRPLVCQFGLRFTPHMARHFGGKQLNRTGAGLKTIMGALDHADPQSSVRYQDADLEIVREAMGRVGRLSAPGKRPGNAGRDSRKSGGSRRSAVPLRRQTS